MVKILIKKLLLWYRRTKQKCLDNYLDTFDRSLFLLAVVLFIGCTKTATQPQPELCVVEIPTTFTARPGKPNKPPKHQRNNHVLLLDFDGQTVTSPHWNDGQTITCLPAQLTAEQQQQVVGEVAALFAAYRLTVTDNETVYNSTHATKRQRIIITPTSFYGGVSGISYIGQMNWGTNTPAFVFSDKLYNIPHFIAEIVAHEAGHSMASLRHQSEYKPDCSLLYTYKFGAVMGNSLYVPQGAWIYGTTYSCNAWQDDNRLLINKFGLR